MSGSLDEQIANSGKDIFMLQSDKEASDFWREESRAKIVMLYLQGCGFCHKFAPEFIKMAPTKANSDLLFGSASHSNIAKVAQFIPALSINGFPTTILVDKNNEVRHVIPGYTAAHNVIDAIEAKLPELRGLPSLQYLQVVRRQSIEAERARSGAAAAAVVSNRAQLPSMSTGTLPDIKLASDTKLNSHTVAVGVGPADMSVGSGVAGEHALPPHLRHPPTTAQPAEPAIVRSALPPIVGSPLPPIVGSPLPPIVRPPLPPMAAFSGSAAAPAATARLLRPPLAASSLPRTSAVALAGRRHKSAKKRSVNRGKSDHGPRAGGGGGAEEPAADKSWCTIL